MRTIFKKILVWIIRLYKKMSLKNFFGGVRTYTTASTVEGITHFDKIDNKMKKNYEIEDM